MSELIVIGYDDDDTAERVLDEVQAMQKDYLIDLDDAAVVRRTPEGKLKVQTPGGSIGGGAIGGAFWGMLLGVLFLVPLAGAAIGGLVGALMRKGVDLGIKDDFKERVGDLVAPGRSAVMLVVRKSTPEKVLEELKPYGGTVLRTSLTHADEEALAKALGG
jgi:uncharacterized membrane protein